MRAMTRDIRQDQTGLVSIVVTMIMMVIMSLIIIGFARISRRELRQGLDRQLVSQANYAAESGVNDAQAYLRGGGTLSPTAATTCNSYTNPGNGLPKAQEIGDPSIVTSCVLVDSTTRELVYDNVGTDSEVVFPLKSTATINRISISWDSGSGAKFDPTRCQTTAVQLEDGLVPASGWTCPVGGLKIDILPIGSNVNRLALLVANSSALVMPRPSGPTTRSLGSLNTLQQFTTACSATATPRSCNLDINTNNEREFYVRIRPIYQSANIYVQGWTGGSNPVDLIGAQAVIDSTGRASDVLKRLVVRVPTCPSGLECGKRPASSGTALQLAETLCKQYGVIPPSTVTAPSSPAQCQLP